MKRFLAFAFDAYYPIGGMNDKIGEYDTLEEAVVAVDRKHCDFWQVLDIETGEVTEK